MAFPRRFLFLLFFSAFALLTTFFFLGREQYPLSIPTSLPDSWSTTPKPAESETHGDSSNDQNGAVQTAPVTEPSLDTTIKNATELELVRLKDKISAEIAKAMPKTPPGGPPKYKLKPDKPIKELRVSVVESDGSQEEATAALVYAFGRQPKAQISLYQLEARFGITDIIKDFNLTEPIVAYKSSLDFASSIKNSPPPQILVSATCEQDIINLSDSFEALLAGGKTYLFCIIHHPEQWTSGEERVDKILPWVNQQMVDFVGVSAHTAHYLRTASIANWDFNATVTVQNLPPVFPVNLPNTTHAPDGTKLDPPEGLKFAMQGDADPSQNNYTDIFSSFDAVLEKAKNITIDVNTTISRDVALHLLNHTRAPSAVPSNLIPHLIFESQLTYLSYYTLLSQTFALIPYLALPDLLTRSASPSIPAALIAGTPLVANREVLEAYSYVPLDAVWLQQMGEGEMDTMRRVVTWSEKEYERKRGVVRRRAERLVERNVELVEEFVKQGMRRVERAAWRMGNGKEEI